MTPEDPKPQFPPNFFRAGAISAAIILLWAIVYFILAWRAGIPGIQMWGFVSIIALLATVISPLAYGWYSRDSTGAIITGALPFLLAVGISRIISSPSLSDLIHIVGYFLSLGIICGLEGYFAARKTPRDLVIALLLAGIWVGILLSGIR